MTNNLDHLNEVLESQLEELKSIVANKNVENHSESIKHKKYEIQTTINSCISIINTSKISQQSISQFKLIYCKVKELDDFYSNKLKLENEQRLLSKNVFFKQSLERKDKIRNLNKNLIEINNLNEVINDSIHLHDTFIDNLSLQMEQSKIKSDQMNEELKIKLKRTKKWKWWYFVVYFIIGIVVLKLVYW